MKTNKIGTISKLTETEILGASVFDVAAHKTEQISVAPVAKRIKENSQRK